MSSLIQLKLERSISFEEISIIIQEESFIDILEDPKRDNQRIYVIEINDYIYAVPFVVDEDEDIILKTVFPSRKLHKKYRGV